jgi:ABC-2 type transport system permease protein
MSGLDLTPAAAAAPRAARIGRHAVIETRLIVRNGEQLLLALVIPLGLIIANAAVGARIGIAREPFIASVIALGLWSTGFTSVAITTAFERRYGVLERLVSTPLRRADLLLGKAAMVAIVALGQAMVLAVAGLLAGWSPRPSPGSTLVGVVTVTLGLVTFTGLALILAGTASAELTLGLANLVYLLAAAVGLLVPLAAFPAWSQPLIALLPTTAVAEALRAWSGEAAAGPFPGWTIVVTLVWALIAVVIARKVFRWTS